MKEGTESGQPNAVGARQSLLEETKAGKARAADGLGCVLKFFKGTVSRLTVPKADNCTGVT